MESIYRTNRAFLERVRAIAKGGSKGGGEKGGGEGGEKEGEEHQDAPEYVQWMAQDHGRPAVALQPSPFFPNIMVSVGDWHFQIWMLGRQVPIFASPSSSIYLTCGRWSPTRPGILYIGKQDGNVDV